MRDVLARTVLTLLVIALGVAAFAARPDAPEVRRQGVIHSVLRGDLRYDFNAAWRNETLWRQHADGTWRRVESPDEESLAPLRRTLLDALGADGLDAVPAAAGDELRALRSLGYL